MASIASFDMDAAVQAFCLVGIAEIFDKTWFVALLMALKYDKVVVFWSCFLGLAAHVAIAGVFGYTVAKMIPIRYLDFGAAALYAFFAILFYKDYLDCDPESDIIEAGKEEAAEDCEEAIKEDEKGYGSVEAQKAAQKSKFRHSVKVFMGCLTAMFIAEWGDRTQIAMIGAASSRPVVPVCVGSMVAFFMLTLSAVLVGGLLAGQKLSEKLVHLISAISFVVFAGLAVREGILETN